MLRSLDCDSTDTYSLTVVIKPIDAGQSGQESTIRHDAVTSDLVAIDHYRDRKLPACEKHFGPLKVMTLSLQLFKTVTEARSHLTELIGCANV